MASDHQAHERCMRRSPREGKEYGSFACTVQVWERCIARSFIAQVLLIGGLAGLAGLPAACLAHLTSFLDI